MGVSHRYLDCTVYQELSDSANVNTAMIFGISRETVYQYISRQARTRGDYE